MKTEKTFEEKMEILSAGGEQDLWSSKKKSHYYLKTHLETLNHFDFDESREGIKENIK